MSPVGLHWIIIKPSPTHPPFPHLPPESAHKNPTVVMPLSPPLICPGSALPREWSPSSFRCYLRAWNLPQSFFQHHFQQPQRVPHFSQVCVVAGLTLLCVLAQAARSLDYSAPAPVSPSATIPSMRHPLFSPAGHRLSFLRCHKALWFSDNT